MSREADRTAAAAAAATARPVHRALPSTGAAAAIAAGAGGNDEYARSPLPYDLVFRIAEYEQRGRCVGGARVRAPIVRFGARGVAGQAALVAGRADVCRVLRPVGVAGWVRIGTGSVAARLAWR